MIPFPFPPVIQVSETVIPLQEAIEKVMQDIDADDPALPLRDHKVARADQPSLRWLRAAALSEKPENPFRAGTRSSAEAEDFLTLLSADRTQAEALLPKLTLSEPGTALGLWRWATRQERMQPWGPAARAIWEDKLMAKHVPTMLNGYALRHALCWALAEKDETRFASLKAAWGQDDPSLFASFQGLFAWFGELSPVLRLWVLPTLDYQDLRLDNLLAFDGSHSSRIWISPDTTPLPHLPTGTAWLLPSEAGSQNPNESSLNPVEKAAGTKVSMALVPAKGHAYFAPSRAEFEAAGLMFFPILIELDAKGKVQAIRMGDAVANPFRSPALVP